MKITNSFLLTYGTLLLKGFEIRRSSSFCGWPGWQEKIAWLWSKLISCTSLAAAEAIQKSSNVVPIIFPQLFNFHFSTIVKTFTSYFIDFSNFFSSLEVVQWLFILRGRTLHILRSFVTCWWRRIQCRLELIVAWDPCLQRWSPSSSLVWLHFLRQWKQQ